MPTLEFFDCNTRIGTWSNPRPEHFTDADGLLRAMDEAGIARALVYHAWAWQWDAAEGNAQLLREIAGQERLYPALVALPPATREVDAAALVATCREHHGTARAFPNTHVWRMTPWCAQGLLAALTEAGVPLIVDLGETTWDDIAATARAFPGLPLVLVNTSYRIDRYLFPLWEQGCNIIIGIENYMAFLAPEGVTEQFGAERLVFSSGLPERDPGGPVAMVTYAGIAEEDKRKIAGGNLARLVGA
jgi:predicted TIM-barrel fold metal-dependent hydrolase